jgi:hypothetical protein
MKKKEIIRLLGLFDQKDLSSPDFSGFSDPDDARNNFNRLKLVRTELSGHDRSFSPYFTDRVMGRIARISQSPGIEEYLSMLFTRVMTYGLTAVVLVVLTLYFLHGPEGFSAVLGTDNSNDVNFISYLFYEF